MAKDCKSLVKSIKPGESGLAYYLTEFGAQDMHVWEGVIESIASKTSLIFTMYFHTVYYVVP
jgi:hypothetical protein